MSQNGQRYFKNRKIGLGILKDSFLHIQKQPPEVFSKKGVLKTSQISYEHTCVSLFLIKVQTWELQFY